MEDQFHVAIEMDKETFRAGVLKLLNGASSLSFSLLEGRTIV